MELATHWPYPADVITYCPYPTLKTGVYEILKVDKTYGTCPRT